MKIIGWKEKINMYKEFTTKHYVFRYQANSLAEIEIKEIAAEPDKVYAVYNKKIKCIGPHEDAHLISYKINIPDSTFLREGLAMFFDRSWWGIANREWTAFFRKRHMEKSIVNLFSDSNFDEVDCGISYPIAGAFTEHLICRYGLEKYLEFYRCNDADFSQSAEKIFHNTLEKVEEMFWLYVDGESLDAELITIMDKNY